ncbi:MAG: GNAT family N-acetyltransferase [Gemmatimonadales bacterium]
MNLGVIDGITLRSLTAADAPALFSVVEAHRTGFDPWLRWSAAIRDEAGAAAFIAAATEREARGQGFHLGCQQDGDLVGGIPCWSLDPVHRVAELGYWLVPNLRGRRRMDGLLRAAVARLFDGLSVNRIEFQCLINNIPSRRVAERLGAKFEGIRRESHFVAGGFRDHAVYSLLAREAPGRQAPQTERAP